MEVEEVLCKLPLFSIILDLIFYLISHFCICVENFSSFLLILIVDDTNAAQQASLKITGVKILFL